MAELKKHPAETDEKTDKSALKALLDKASQLKKDDYTGTTWEKFQKAFDDASNIYESTKATQEQIDVAAAALEAAMGQLEKSLPDQMKNRKHRQTTKTTALEALSKTIHQRRKPKRTSSAKTGDETPIGMFAGVGALALIAILACVLSILKKRKRA